MHVNYANTSNLIASGSEMAMKVAVFSAMAAVCFLASSNLAAAEPVPLPADMTDPIFVQVHESAQKRFVLAKIPATPNGAKDICHRNNGRLVSFQDQDEYHSLTQKLGDFPQSQIWTGGISFSNSSVEELLIWDEIREPMSFNNFANAGGSDSDSRGRSRRQSYLNFNNDGKTPCNCDCSTTPAPFTRAPCRKPVCQISTPTTPCIQKQAKHCILTGLPECTVRRHNCTVDCNEPCRVIEQPVCKVKPSSTPRCFLKQPGPCETMKPNCTVVHPGSCRAEKPECVQIDTPCRAKIVPCNKTCVEVECTTIKPSCTPGPGETCPGPVSSCTRPFVDCSPNICQSFVQICQPPKIICNSPTIICDSPKVNCDAAASCPDPEVVCVEPELECSKPKVQCPDAVVHCDPIITSCGQAPLSCTEPEFECPESEITCESSVTCPIEGPPEIIPPSCCEGQCINNGGQQPVGKKLGYLVLAEEAEKVEKKLCVAIRKDLGYRWVTESCNAKYNFLCEISKV